MRKCESTGTGVAQNLPSPAFLRIAVASFQACLPSVAFPLSCPSVAAPARHRHGTLLVSCHYRTLQPVRVSLINEYPQQQGRKEGRKEPPSRGCLTHKHPDNRTYSRFTACSNYLMHAHPRTQRTITPNYTRLSVAHGRPHLHGCIKHLQDVGCRLLGDWGGRGSLPARPLHTRRVRERVVERCRRLLPRCRAARLRLGCKWVLRRTHRGSAETFWGRAALYMLATTLNDKQVRQHARLKPAHVNSSLTKY